MKGSIDEEPYAGNLQVRFCEGEGVYGTGYTSIEPRMGKPGHKVRRNLNAEADFSTRPRFLLFAKRRANAPVGRTGKTSVKPHVVRNFGGEIKT